MLDETLSLERIEHVGRQERQRFHFQSFPISESIRRYDRSPENTIDPLEYACHLMGNIRGKVVVDLGCGEGRNTVILAALGARVLAVDVSATNLEITRRRASAEGVVDNVTLLHSDAVAIPVRDALADHVFCASRYHHFDPLGTARQIRRVLRPGGSAVFKEPLAGPLLLKTLRHPGVRLLTIDEVAAVGRAVGRPGRSKAFWLSTRVLCRMGAPAICPVTRASQRLDAALLHHFPFTRRFASPLVWEARKEC